MKLPARSAGEGWPCWMIGLLLVVLATTSPAQERRLVKIPSTMDQTLQPSYVILPEGFDADAGKVPLLVSLHSWSADYNQRNTALEKEVAAEGWVILMPNFRGRNDSPQACGSKLAQQDILDAVDWAKKNYPIDASRVYLTGNSGGGHMTMLMVARHPDVWAAASAWVGISDLAAWQRRHANGKYGKMVVKCCGGVPGSSAAVDAEYTARSPLTHLANAKDVPLDLAAGIHDGHEGSVPIVHTLAAFNVLAKAVDGEPVTDEEIAQLSREKPLENPQLSDQVEDETFGRKIYLRRTAGRARVTIFEGGHEGLATAVVPWLKRHQKQSQ